MGQFLEKIALDSDIYEIAGVLPDRIAEVMATDVRVVVSEIEFWDDQTKGKVAEELDRRFITTDELCDMVTSPNEVREGEGGSFLFIIELPQTSYWVQGVRFDPHFYALRVAPFADALGNPCWLAVGLDIDYCPRPSNRLLYECKDRYYWD